jgi:hypothetical protein
MANMEAAQLMKRRVSPRRQAVPDKGAPCVQGHTLLRYARRTRTDSRRSMCSREDIGSTKGPLTESLHRRAKFNRSLNRSRRPGG